MPATERHNTTEDAIADEIGHAPTCPYFLRADQLSDGSYRYAIEERNTGRVLAEGMHASDHEALMEFERNLAASGLTREEIEAIRKAADRYDGAD